MPYLLISTKIKLDEGPTYCGDEWTNAEVMTYVDAKLVQEFGNTSKGYLCDDPPRIVLDKLEQIGYKLMASTGIGQTIVWTLHKPDKKASSLL